MIQEENSDLKLDLVFKLSNNFSSIKNKLSQENKLIFQYSFWEKVFLCWIKLIKDDNKFDICNRFFRNIAKHYMP